MKRNALRTYEALLKIKSEVREMFSEQQGSSQVITPKTQAVKNSEKTSEQSKQGKSLQSEQNDSEKPLHSEQSTTRKEFVQSDGSSNSGKSLHSEQDEQGKSLQSEQSEHVSSAELNGANGYKINDKVPKVFAK